MDLVQLEAILMTGLSTGRKLEPVDNDMPITLNDDKDGTAAVRSISLDGQVQRAIRSEVITLRVTPAQKRSLLQWCRGMDLSTYIRLFIFDLRTNQALARFIPTVNRQTYLELMQINEVIRQESVTICKQLCNSGQPDDSDFDNKLALHLQQLQQLEALIQEIRLTLISPNGAIRRQL